MLEEEQESLWIDNVETLIPTEYGLFKLRVYKPREKFIPETVVFYQGNLQGKSNVLVRIHSECLTGEVFASQKCDCGSQLKYAMELISKQKSGMIIYLRQEGRGIGLFNKIRAYRLQEEGLDTLHANLMLDLPADARTYEWSVAILHDFGINKIQLMTNNPLKEIYLKSQGIYINRLVPIETGVCEHNMSYLKSKKELMGHRLSLNVSSRDLQGELNEIV